MGKNILILVVIMIAVGLISAALAYFRAGSIAIPGEVAAKGLAAVRKGMLTLYGIYMPVLVGVAALFVFRYMNTRWPASAETNFLGLAVGLAVVLTIGAAVFFKRGIVEFALIHILYTAGFGWLMPKLLSL